MALYRTLSILLRVCDGIAPMRFFNRVSASYLSARDADLGQRHSFSAAIQIISEPRPARMSIRGSAKKGELGKLRVDYFGFYPNNAQTGTLKKGTNDAQNRTPTDRGRMPPLLSSPFLLEALHDRRVWRLHRFVAPRVSK